MAIPVNSKPVLKFNRKTNVGTCNQLPVDTHSSDAPRVKLLLDIAECALLLYECCGCFGGTDG